MGVVYLGRDLRLDRPVPIRLLLEALAQVILYQSDASAKRPDSSVIFSSSVLERNNGLTPPHGGVLEPQSSPPSNSDRKASAGGPILCERSLIALQMYPNTGAKTITTIAAHTE
jgi:hypothetical protein